MTRPALQAESSRVAWNGKGIVIIPSPVMAFDTVALDNQGSFVAPCDLEIAAIVLNCITTASSANALLNIGKRGAADSFVDGYSLDNHTTGVKDIVNDATVVSKEIDAGDVVEFQLEAATAAGSLAVTLVCNPRFSD